MPSQPKPVLKPDYYLDNFNQLLDFVANHYWPLLNEHERAHYASFQTLSGDAQRLYVRLLTRSKNCFRLGKLKYPEILDIPSAASELHKGELASVVSALPTADLLPLFTCAELSLAIQQPADRRPALLARIIDNEENLQRLNASDRYISIAQIECFTVYRLLYFGNLYQDLRTFVLRDIGMSDYEDYPIDATTLPFRSREQLDRHLQLYECRAAFELTCTDGRDELLGVASQLPAANGDSELQRRIDKLVIKIARQLERHNHWQDALQLYATTKLAPARERRVRILAKKNELDAAHTLCVHMINNPESADEIQFAEYFGPRLARKTGKPWNKKTRTDTKTETVWLATTELPVELAAARHYHQSGECYYVENSLLNSVLGLAIWDIIFAPVAGTFFHPFQSAPADFYCPEFSVTRATLLEKRWGELRAGELQSITIRRFRKSHGKMNPLVDWRNFDQALLTLAIRRIPIEHWLAMFDYLLLDTKNNRSGLPDLVHFPDQGGYQFIEVKGPGDRLQKNQKSWMREFAKHHIPHSVVNVKWEKSVVSSAR